MPDHISLALPIKKEPGDDLPYRGSIHKVFCIHYQENVNVRFPVEPYQDDAVGGYFLLQNVQGVLFSDGIRYTKTEYNVFGMIIRILSRMIGSNIGSNKPTRSDICIK